MEGPWINIVNFAVWEVLHHAPNQYLDGVMEASTCVGPDHREHGFNYFGGFQEGFKSKSTKIFTEYTQGWREVQIGSQLGSFSSFILTSISKSLVFLIFKILFFLRHEILSVTFIIFTVTDVR
jgi:hypothetical protein